MDLIFVAPSTPFPSGGVAVIYEYASHMAERGHAVRLYHVPIFDHQTDMREIAWFSFAPGVEHVYSADAVDLEALGPADIIFGFRPDGTQPPHTGLPVVVVQGWKMMRSRHELAMFRAPCPKVCVSRWLVEVGREQGIPAEQLVHIPLGLDHETFRVVRPIADRPPQVSFCYNSHVHKGAETAIAVFERVKETVPEVEVAVFGARPLEHELPSWVRYHLDPPRSELVDDIYNRSRVFLSSSIVEGFGLPCVEAMACGAALVTTDNGGSRDYATHDETALVADPRDVDRLAANVVALLHDTAQRVRIAEAGRDVAAHFEWDRSCALLEAFLERYLDDPVSFGVPSGMVEDIRRHSTT